MSGLGGRRYVLPIQRNSVDGQVSHSLDFSLLVGENQEFGLTWNKLNLILGTVDLGQVKEELERSPTLSASHLKFA